MPVREYRRAGFLEDLPHGLRSANPLLAAFSRSLVRSARLSPGRLEALQERRLRGLVRWAAARSPFYRRWFAESGVDPGSIRTLADLERMPVLMRKDLVERPRELLAYPATLVWSSHSSGTSGEPVTAYRTIGSVVFELAALERRLGWLRIPRRARRAILARKRACRRSRRRPGPSGRFRALGERRHPRRLRGAGPSRPRSRPRSSLGLLERSQRPLVLPDHGFPEAAPRPPGGSNLWSRRRRRQPFSRGPRGAIGARCEGAGAGHRHRAGPGGAARHGTPRGPGMDRMWWSPRV
jgi:hypothetical protein